MNRKSYYGDFGGQFVPETIMNALIELEKEYEKTIDCAGGKRALKPDFLYNNKIVEFYGDFWHANPDIYKEDDILNFGSIKQSAKNIWQKDLNNINFAKEQNYIVYILWENYIISHTDNDIKKYILTLLN